MSGAPADVVFEQVACGNVNACGRRPGGAVLCWGTNVNSFIQPPAGAGFTQISAGGQMGCGVREDGTADCWGYDSGGNDFP